MRVLIACEESQAVCIAFRKMGHDAFSCDIQECSGGHPEWHFQQDVFEVIDMGWDLMIAHPPCTHLAVSGSRSFPEKIADGRQSAALNFVRRLMDVPIPRTCIENPISIISSHIKKPDQIIHPYYFGDNVPKKTCLWLKGLPKLIYCKQDNLFEKATLVEPEYIEYNSKKNKSGKSKYSVLGKLGKGKGKERSKTFQGIANAMAVQWGCLL